MRFVKVFSRFVVVLALALMPRVAGAQSQDLKESLAAAAAARNQPVSATPASTLVSLTRERAAALLKAEAARLGWTSTRSEAGLEQWSAVTDSGTVQVRVDLESAAGGTRLKAGGDERGRVLAQKLLLLARGSGLQ